jgi:exonuclease III
MSTKSKKSPSKSQKYLTFLMWNIKGRGSNSLITGALKDLNSVHKPDFLLLIESDLTDNEVEKLCGTRLQSVMLDSKKTLRLYSKKSLTNVVNEEEEINSETTRVTQRIVFFNFDNGKSKLLLVGVHFPSKYMLNAESQYKAMRKWSTLIKAQEQIHNTDKTIIFGDLNLNPFDHALYQNDALFSHPVVHTKPKFYNPMWSLLGDYIYKSNTKKIPGTYYFNPGGNSVGEFHWNCIDSVLIGKSLEKDFVRKELEIITEIKKHKLASTDKIYSDDYSDHLPVKFKLKL